MGAAAGAVDGVWAAGEHARVGGRGPWRVWRGLAASNVHSACEEQDRAGVPVEVRRAGFCAR